MHLPDLAPDIGFELLPGTEAALRFAFEVKRAAMGPHIIARWGWDEAFQLAVHTRHFAAKPFFAVKRHDAPIGTVSMMPGDDHIRFGEFYLLPEHHGHGLGTRILRHCLDLADIRALPVRLEYLKWNPVGRLYRRHGFAVTGETDIHMLMERAAGAEAQAVPVGCASTSAQNTR
ncbi:MAG: GNAT family N-acetyltransferase [Rhizobiales bacterium]|nr:GNAT family N-acetyltransferase [Hyphomicrobiales bacterium]